MILHIHDQKQIAEVQKEFSMLFPYLKLEFFKKPHSKGEATNKNYLIRPETKLADCRNKPDSGFIEISGEMTVNELEQAFEKQFGLSVQVFRNSGKIWLETTVTDGWTLQKQNEEGKSLAA